MPADYIVKAGDNAPAFIQTLSLADGSAVNLNSTTVTFEMRSLTSSSTLPLTGTVTVLNGAAGQVQYTPTTTDTAVAGSYMANWVVTYQTGTVMSFPTDGYLWVQVEPSLATETQQLVSLPDVKEYLGMVGTQHDRDHELLTMIEGMRPQIEQITGPIIPQVFDEKYDGGNSTITLRNRPAVGYGTSPILTLMAASEYRGVREYPLSIVANQVFGSIYSIELDSRTGTVTRRTAGGGTIGFIQGRNSIRLIYQSGQSSVPANVRLACLEVIRVNFRTTAPSGRGRLAEADTEFAAEKMPFGLSRRAREMLAPTRRAPSIA